MKNEYEKLIDSLNFIDEQAEKGNSTYEEDKKRSKAYEKVADLTMAKRVVTFGEIMLRLAPQGFLRFSQADNFDVVYGGGESNVAVSLANFGIPVDFVTRLPKNDIGECAMMEMRKRGVGVENIVWVGYRDWETDRKSVV